MVIQNTANSFASMQNENRMLTTQPGNNMIHKLGREQHCGVVFASSNHATGRCRTAVAGHFFTVTH